MTCNVWAQEENTEDVTTVETEDFSMELPAACYILGQSIEEDNPYLEKTGADKTQIEEYFQTAGIVVDAVAQDDTYEIVVTVTQNQDVTYIYNMKSLSDDTLKEFGNTILESYETYGYTVEGMDVYETLQTKYVRLEFRQTSEDATLSCEQYYTIRGNQVYNFTLRYYDEQVPQSMKTQMEQIIESVQFLETADDSVYTNTDAGVTFSVKDGWNAAAEQKKDNYIQMQYTNDLGESIQFLCMDLWGNMDVLHQFVQTREEMDLQHELTDKDRKTYERYLEVFFEDYDQTEQIIKNQVYYLTQEEPLEVKTNDEQETYLQKSYVTVKNGILYVFQYGYYEGSGLHEADFHEMMETVSYEEAGLLENDEVVYQQITKVGFGIVTAMLLIIVILIFIVYLYITGYKNKDLK